MCFDPVSLSLMLAAGGISGLGSWISNSEDRRNAEAMAEAKNKVLVDTMNKNNVIANDARGMFNGNLQTYDPAAVATTQADVTGQRGASINSNLPTTSPGLTPSSATPQFVRDAMAAAEQSAESKSADRADSAARLGGFGDMFQKLGEGTASSANKVNTDINFASANNNLLPTLQDLAAYQVYKPNSGLGGLLQGLGSAFGSYAGSL